MIESGFYQRYISGGFRPGYDIGEESKIFDGLLIKIYYLNKNLIGILDENFAASDDNNLIKVKEIINFVKCELEDATAHHLNLSYFIKHFNQVDQLSLRYLTEHFKQARQSFQAIIPLYCALSEVTLVVLACALAMEKMPENSAQFLAVLSERLTEIVPMPLPPPQPEKLILKIDEIEIQSFDDLYAQRNKISNSFWAPKNLPIIANLFSSIDEFLKFTPTHRLVKLIKSQPKTLVKLFTRCDDIINFHQKMWTALEETDSVHPDDIWEIGKFLMEQAPLVFQSDTELTSAILYSLKFGSSCQSNFIKAHLDQIVAYFNERDKFIGLIKLNINGELACKLIERLSAVRAELLSLPETILDLIQYSEQLSLLLLRDLDAAAIFDSTEKVLYAFENSKEIPLFLCQTYPGDIISRITSLRFS
ncbi:MAG: hypothetical protein HWD59_04265 [Coxiellaceae bacterium]|nr:MAG: hypothetical protein HWD59_04265 [Coxiellaceae bacterium]